METTTPQSFVERRSAWSFTVSGGKWTWRAVRPDKSKSVSQSTFDSLSECIEDAMRSGYVPLKPAVDRRGDDEPEESESGDGGAA